VGLAAKSLNLPIIVHEQILGAGLANKIVGKFAQTICVSWQQSKKFFPQDKVVLTGNPMRKVETSDFKLPESAEKFPIIYITGGSGGSHAINVLIEGCMEHLLEKYLIIHQTGASTEFGDFARLEKRKSQLPVALQKRYIPRQFIDSSEVFSVLKKADLVVSRSGINTITELLALGKPCLFIPLPYGQQHEQLTNALFVKQLGLAEVVEQKSLTAEKLGEVIEKMMNDLEIYKQHSQKAKDLLIPDATQKIIDLIEHGNTQTKITRS
jgi:UDP-N-acetylglucosamine--N-acetylmuramyl-(pentapeptide) pyrophosphoryl-undecaprenol N-acetylglucosamine transferase